MLSRFGASFSIISFRTRTQFVQPRSIARILYCTVYIYVHTNMNKLHRFSKTKFITRTIFFKVNLQARYI